MYRASFAGRRAKKPEQRQSGIRRLQADRRWFAVAAVAAAALAESGLLLGAVFGQPWLSFFAPAHVCLSAIVAVSMFRTRSERTPLLLLLGISFVALGPLGAAGAGLASMLRAPFKKRSTPFEQWYTSLFPEPSKDRSRVLYEIIALRSAGPASRSTVAPFTDVLSLGTVEQKRAVISLIADNFRPEFAAPLRAALNNEEPAIRVQAAGAAAQIESGFVERSMLLQRASEADPENRATRLQVAQHLEAYAASGLLDPARAAALLHDALRIYEDLLKLAEGDPVLSEGAARLQMHLRRPLDAVRSLDALMEGSNAPLPALLVFANALFALRRFDRLRDLCKQFDTKLSGDELPREHYEAVQVWAQASNTLK
jgi:hypothetical protein